MMTAHHAVDAPNSPIRQTARRDRNLQVAVGGPHRPLGRLRRHRGDRRTTASESTVSDYQYSGCSTSVVLGLSRQISDEIGCEHPDGLTRFDATGNIIFTSSSVLPYLAADAKAHLQSVAANRAVQINSAFRTIAQQYLLVRWHAEGRCGITATAAVGQLQPRERARPSTSRTTRR